MKDSNIFQILCVATALCGLVQALPQPGKLALEPYSFEDIFNSSLRPRGFSPRWVPGEDAFYYRHAETRHVMLYNATTYNETILINASVFTDLRADSYFVSSGLTHVLFAYETEPLWRHSFNGKYKIYDLTEKTTITFPFGWPEDSVLEYAQWAPTSTALSFVYRSNLYYQASPDTEDVQITDDGHATDVFNGVPDWLYEEDVISDRVSHYFSPDSKYICYARINVSHVPFISWPLYGEKTDVFGSTREIRYPKAGDVRDGEAGPNSVVDLFVVDVTADTMTSVPIPPPTELALQDHYYLQVAWANTTVVYITWANRVQTYSHSAYYHVEDPSPMPISGHVYSVSGGWVEVPPPTPIFIDSETYITIHPKEMGGNSSWRHLAIFSLQADTKLMFLTDGLEEVDNIYGYDRAKGFIYYSSTNGDPTERHIKRIDTADNSVECLTCNLTESCRYITSSFSASANHYFVNCRGPEIPTYTLHSRLDPTKNISMENNNQVRDLLAMKDLPTRQFLDIAIGGDYQGKAEVFLPPGHVEGNKYPLLVYAYAGPGSQRVMKTYPIGGNTNNWLTYMKSTHKVVVASLDSRGAAGRGDKFKFEMYRKLATVEVQDQILSGLYFSNTPYINQDKSKAMFGWSYGGGTTAHVIGDPTKVFTCGISVAPVSSKAYYDTAYTERYLGLATPDDDPQGYNNTDVMNKVENFRDKAFMIAHGIADDNVHYMHATQLIQALSRAEIMFRQNAYIDQNHGIGHPGASRHLYRSMTNFLLNDCWDGQTEVNVTTTTTSPTQPTTEPDMTSTATTPTITPTTAGTETNSAVSIPLNTASILFTTICACILSVINFV